MSVDMRPSEDTRKDIIDQLYWDSRADAADIRVEAEYPSHMQVPHDDEIRARVAEDTPGVVPVNKDLGIR